MCDMYAYLAYGITVKTESLLYAVAAWPRLQGPFTFLDLVALRKRQGTLVARHSRPAKQGVQTLPVEVWELVRHKLVDVEMRKAEVEHVKSFMCAECRLCSRPEDYTWSEIGKECEADEESLWDFEGLAGSGRRQVRLSSQRSP